MPATARRFGFASSLVGCIVQSIWRRFHRCQRKLSFRPSEDSSPEEEGPESCTVTEGRISLEQRIF